MQVGVVRARPKSRAALSLFLVLLLVAALAPLSPARATHDPTHPQPAAGLWSGTVSFSATGHWDYTIGYRGQETRSTQGSSSHDLGWTMTLTDALGDAEFSGFTGDAGSVTLSSFGWSGSAVNVGQSDCQYAASGSMSTPATGNFSFYGLAEDGTPYWGDPESAVVPLSLSRPECSPGIIFGFSGPNAGTLWEGGGYDQFLLNNYVDYGQAHTPLFTLCTEPLSMASVPTATTENGQTVVRAATTGDCSGRRIEWFGDSDVYHDSKVAVTYTYDLIFQPTSEASDSDGDGIEDGVDNCPMISNSDQSDLNGNGMGDACEDDSDGDGLTDDEEVLTYGTDPHNADTDGGGVPDGVEVANGTDPLSPADDTVSGSCDDEGVDARYTVADGDGSVVLAGLPDVDLAEVSFGVGWCLTDSGARVDGVPTKYVIPTDNWFLVGALEYLGFEMSYPAAPKIEKRLRNVRAKARIGMKLNPIEVLLNVAGATGLLNKAVDGMKVLLRKLDRTNSQERAAALHAEFVDFFKKELRAWKQDFRARVNKRIRNRHPGTTKQADQMAAVFSRELESICDMFERAIVDLPEELVDQGVGAVGTAVHSTFERVFGKFTVPIWDVDATLYLADDGSATLSDGSTGRNIFTVKSEWVTNTTP